MRYFCSHMRAPGAWQQTAETSEVAVIAAYVEEHMQVHDADSCGSKMIYFSFSTGKHYRVRYAWWIDTEDGWELCDSTEYEEIAASEVVGVCADRDWMTLKPAALLTMREPRGAAA